MSEHEPKKRRPRGQAAIGNIDETKRIFDMIISQEAEERRKKTKRLKQLRLAASASPSKAPTENG